MSGECPRGAKWSRWSAAMTRETTITYFSPTISRPELQSYIVNTPTKTKINNTQFYAFCCPASVVQVFMTHNVVLYTFGPAVIRFDFDFFFFPCF